MPPSSSSPHNGGASAQSMTAALKEEVTQKKAQDVYQHKKIHAGLRWCIPWCLLSYGPWVLTSSAHGVWDLLLFVLCYGMYALAAALAPNIANVLRARSTWVWGAAHFAMTCTTLSIAALVTMLPLRLVLTLAGIAFQGSLHEMVYACSKNRTSRHASIINSTPIDRAGHLIVNSDSVDTDKPCPAIFPEVRNALRSSMISILILVGVDVFLVMTPWSALGGVDVHGNLHPLLECAILGAKFHPMINLVANLLQKVPVLLFTRGEVVLSLSSGARPLHNSKLKDFWGGNYNKAISDVGRRAIFDPARKDLKLSATLSSLLVFLWTGFMHAAPLALLPPARWIHVASIFVFFPLHWLVCLFELKWRPSIPRTYLIFAALFPLFGLPWVLVTGVPPVSMPLHSPLS